MKKIFLLSVAVLVSATLSASPVDPTQAMQVAQSFMPTAPTPKKSAKAQAPAQQSGQIVYTHYMPKSGRPAIYVVNIGNGFALVSADDVAHPVLGYNYSKAWPTDGNIPPQVKSFLDDLAAQMEAASEHPQDAETAAEWQNPKQRKTARLTQSNLPDSVGPLLTTTWDQGQYYNAMCPEDGQGPDGHVWTGCVATAMAQIIKYWGDRETIHTRGIHSYNSPYGELTVNYDTTSYDFASMPNQLTAESTSEQISAVAKLMYECGVAVNMGYGASESAADEVEARAALNNFFRFDPNLSYVERISFIDSTWLYLMRKNISSYQPILYTGYGNNGHTFVCDGYRKNDYFHFNFGWGGWFDGWFLITAINPAEEYKYNEGQFMIIGILPDSSSNVIFGQMQGTSTFIVKEQIDFYHLMGNNDYAGINYLDVFNNNNLFVSSDTSSRLVVDIIEYKDQGVDIIDGIDGNTLRVLNSMEENDLSPVVSSGREVRLDYHGKMIYAGFHLIISIDEGCRRVSDVQASIEQDSIQISWNPQGAESSWYIEYGDVGFTHGDGFGFIANTTEITLPIVGLSSTLEFRIQPTCDTLRNHSIFSYIVHHKKYWTDVVSSEPNGFFMNAEEIHISSAEGLAWLAILANSDDLSWDQWGWVKMRNIFIDNDIDLNGYQWIPISDWFGCFDGKGHTISNMYVRDDTPFKQGGFFERFLGDTIQDIGFQNPVVACSSAGTIAASGENAVMLNCFSNNYIINGEYSAHGLIGGGCHSMINCYSAGKIWGTLDIGGLAGYVENSTYNCYSSLTALGGQICQTGLITSGAMGQYENCFADIDYVNNTWSGMYAGLYGAEDTLHGYFLGKPANIKGIKNVAGYTRKDTKFAKLVPNCAINYTYDDNINLITALNKGVHENNSPKLRTWVWDSIAGLPKFGGYYEVTCPNVSEIQATNIKQNGDFFVVLTWKENGSAQEWQIKYVPESMSDDSAFTYTTRMMCDTIRGLTLATPYKFYIRPLCEESDTVGWNQPIIHFVDIPYWTDVVKNCPPGYVEDNEGDIYISSAEGMAWLSVCSNGLNGQTQTNYEDKTVNIIADIDMGEYRWKPICQWENDGKGVMFKGDLNGLGHKLTHIYCNDLINSDNHHVGFIGCAELSTIKNIIIDSCNIIGMSFVGALAGECIGCIIDNCHGQNVYIKGSKNIGGLIGEIYAYDFYNTDEIISNCSSTGNVFGDSGIGGLVGICSGWNDYVGEAINCYSTVNIYSVGLTRNDAKGGLVSGINSFNLKNCYSTGDVDYIIDFVHGNVIGASFGGIGYNCDVKNVYAKESAQNLPFYADGYPDYETWNISDTASFNSTSILDTAIPIHETSHTDLLSVLNAWVDANNEDGKYRHWVADTENINGGFPIFDPSETPTGIDNTKADANAKATKIFRNGQIFILRGDKVYTLQGQEVK